METTAKRISPLLIKIILAYILGLFVSGVLDKIIFKNNYWASLGVTFVYYLVVLGFLITERTFIKNVQAEEKSLTKKSCKITAIILASIILIVKEILSYKALHQILGYPLFGTENAILYLFYYLLTSSCEEFFFKGLIYESLRKKRVPFIVSLIICSVLFAVIHCDFNFKIIGYLFVFSIMLCLYRLYPSLIFISIFHWLWNISLVV